MMTGCEFNIACENAMVDVEIALENENIRKALKDRKDDLVITILNEEF